MLIFTLSDEVEIFQKELQIGTPLPRIGMRVMN